MTTLKVGVIGVGGIAGTHMPGWAASPHTEVIAGSDISQDAVDTWAAKWGVAQTSTDSADLINNPDIDIIDICTPNNYHTPLAIAALEAGKHVICEKPLAPTEKIFKT
ncbi:MAG: Gfo/Idh/MocA family oxidoreductase [Anaerolineae bacterium]|nr:Gfo/Idh/MocA family oxidoreductase [Anaerolineae bacterium]MDQ7034932.1 Gfo/Idh/MocA family oxidoreductase [Anaerolineae bacterium]